MTYPTGNANASKITFLGANSVLGMSGKTNTITGQLEVGNGGSLTLAGSVTLQAPVTVGSGSLLTLTGALVHDSGNDGVIVKNGEGELRVATSEVPDTISYKISGGKLSFTEGGTLGAINMSGGNTDLVFSGTGKTYSTGVISTADTDNYNRNIVVDSGVTVNVAADNGNSFCNYNGMKALRVDGVLKLAGSLLMSSGTNNSSANNMITGSGVIYATSLTMKNQGTYNISINELNLSEYTCIDKAFNFTGGTINMNGYSGYVTATNINGGTLNLVGAFRTNNNGVINVNSGALNIKSTATSESENNEQNYNNTIQVLNVAKGAVVTVETDAIATIASATIAAPIVNKGNLTLSGTLAVSALSGFTPEFVGGGTPIYVDADGNAAANGYLSGERRYTLISNTGTLVDDAITSVSGAEGTYAAGVLTTSAADLSTFYVNTTVEAVALGEGKKYCINGGTLQAGTDVGNILKTATGSTGTITITQSDLATGNENLTTQFKGTLELAPSVSFTLGRKDAGSGSDTKEINTSTLSAVKLNNGSTLRYNGNGKTTLKNLSVVGGTAAIYYEDANKDNAVQIAEKTDLTGNLNVSTHYDGAISFARLSGAGNLAASGSDSEFRFTVNSLQEYEGAISITKGGGTYKAVISTGSSAVNFKGISISGAANVTLNVQSATAMSEGLSLSQGTVSTVNIADGGSFTGAVKVTGTGNSLTSTAGGMNLSQLNVAEGAALDLNGSVSALLMNQAGMVDIAGLSLTDGAVLTYGNAANLLKVTDGMLAGNVVIASGLTLTASGVDLGLSSAIEQGKIGISQYEGAELAVVGETWHLKATVVRYFWENFDNNNYFAHGKWSLTDDDTTNPVSLPSELSDVVLVYSNAGTAGSPNVMRLNAVKSVNGVEVVNGFYRLWTDENTGNLSCSGDLSLSSNGHLILDLPMSATGLNMATNSELTIIDLAMVNSCAIIAPSWLKNSLTLNR